MRTSEEQTKFYSDYCRAVPVLSDIMKKADDNLALTRNETKRIQPMEVSETNWEAVREHLPRILSLNSPTDLADQTDYKNPPQTRVTSLGEFWAPVGSASRFDYLRLERGIESSARVLDWLPLR